MRLTNDLSSRILASRSGNSTKTQNEMAGKQKATDLRQWLLAPLSLLRLTNDESDSNPGNVHSGEGSGTRKNVGRAVCATDGGHHRRHHRIPSN